MEEQERIPRDLMTVKVIDLKAGETAWVRRYDTHITENGRVFVKKDASFSPLAYDTWIRGEARQDHFVVERDIAGFKFHVLTRDTIIPDHGPISKDQRGEYLKIERVIVHAKEDAVCPHCQGLGITNLSGMEPTGVRDTGYKLLKRIEDQLKKLEVVEENPGTPDPPVL